MTLAVASGVPGFAGVTSTSTYTTEIWSGKMLVKFYSATVFASIANTDYEGEIKSQGDRVLIRTTPDITISDYQIGQALNVQRPTGNKVELTIDRAKYWNFIADEVQKMQSDIAYVEKWTEDAGRQQAIAVDKTVLGEVYASVDAANAGNAAGKASASINLGVAGTPLQFTASNALDAIIDANTCMDEQNIPENDRFIVLPPWAINKVKRSDLQQVQITGDAKSPLRNGLVGTVDRSMLYTSNNLARVSDSGGSLAWNCVFGQKAALTFASQLTMNESLKAESTFGTLYRGLQVFGFKVVKPEALGCLYIKR